MNLNLSDMKENSKLPEILGNTSLSKYMGGTSNRKKNLIHRYERVRNSGIRSVNVTGDNRYLIITFEGRAGIIRVLDLEKLSCRFPTGFGSIKIRGMNDAES